MRNPRRCCCVVRVRTAGLISFSLYFCVSYVPDAVDLALRYCCCGPRNFYSKLKIRHSISIHTNQRARYPGGMPLSWVGCGAVSPRTNTRTATESRSSMYSTCRITSYEYHFLHADSPRAEQLNSYQKGYTCRLRRLVYTYELFFQDVFLHLYAVKTGPVAPVAYQVILEPWYRSVW